MAERLSAIRAWLVLHGLLGIVTLRRALKRAWPPARDIAVALLISWGVLALFLAVA